MIYNTKKIYKQIRVYEYEVSRTDEGIYQKSIQLRAQHTCFTLLLSHVSLLFFFSHFVILKWKRVCIFHVILAKPTKKYIFQTHA